MGPPRTGAVPDNIGRKASAKFLELHFVVFVVLGNTYLARLSAGLMSALLWP